MTGMTPVVVVGMSPGLPGMVPIVVASFREFRRAGRACGVLRRLSPAQCKKEQQHQEQQKDGEKKGDEEEKGKKEEGKIADRSASEQHIPATACVARPPIVNRPVVWQRRVTTRE